MTPLRGWTLAAAAAIALSLTACSGAPPTISSSPIVLPSAPAPSPSASPAAPVGPVADPDLCAGAVIPVLVDDPDDPEQLGGATLAVPIDRGPMPHAEGKAILDEHGIPVAYVVAPNDVIEFVRARFCVAGAWLHWVNYVRRDGEELYVGDTLNLDAHTILSVGDQNGVVHDNPMPDGFVIPPQREPTAP